MPKIRVLREVGPFLKSTHIFLLEGWLTTLRKLSIKGCVWEGNVPPSARSAKLKVIHGLK